VVSRSRDWLLFDSADIRILPEDLKTVSLVKAWLIRVEFEDTTERLKDEIAGRSRVRSGPGDVEEIVTAGVVTEVEAVRAVVEIPAVPVISPVEVRVVVVVA